MRHDATNLLRSRSPRRSHSRSLPLGFLHSRLVPGAVNVALHTTLGTIVVQLDRGHAPLTTANFLSYVERRAYDGATFYRTVPRNPRPAA